MNSSPLTAYLSKLSFVSTLQERIAELMAATGLSVGAMADIAGVSSSAVSQWKDGPTKALKTGPATRLADRTGFCARWIADGDGPKMMPRPLANTDAGPELKGRVPLISNVQAGAFREFVDNYQPGDGGEELIATSVPVKRHTFALRVTGDSMEPEFLAGMILIIEPELEPNPGDYVVAKNGGDETTFKQLVSDGGDWYLKPLNARYPIKPLGKSQIIGVLRAVEKRYR